MAFHQKHTKISAFHDTLPLPHPPVSPKALKNTNFSRNSRTWVSISLHQKHSKNTTFQDTFALRHPSRSTKSTQKSQLFRIPSHLGIYPITPKAFKNINLSGYLLTFVSIRLHQKHSKTSTYHETLKRGYPWRYTKSTQKSQLFRIPSYLGIHLVTQKPVKSLNFPGYSLTWVSIPLKEKHSKISAFHDTLSLRYTSRYTKSTQKSQHFRIPSHLGIYLFTPKARTNLNFSGYTPTCVSISLHQKHSKISTFQHTVAVGYPSRHTKSTQKSQIFMIPRHFGMHHATRKALKNHNFSGYPLTGLSIPLHHKHSEISTFPNTLSRGHPSRYTKSTQKSRTFRIPSHMGIQLVTREPLKNFNFSRDPLTWVSISLHQKHSKISTFQGTFPLGHPSRSTKSTEKSPLVRIPSHLGIYPITPKALKNINLSKYLLTLVSIRLHQKHSKISTYHETLSVGYPWRYTKSTQKSQLFRISSYLGIHLVTPKALRNLNRSGDTLT